MLESALYIVPTPIGNLQDITYRAAEVLRQATLIAAEDTRHSKILLDSLGAGPKKMFSCNDHNEAERVDMIVNALEAGEIVALISDAGTPMISDPGYRVVSQLCARGCKVIALPGPCAAITALCAAGLPTDKFLFAGFLPVKDKELRERLEEICLNNLTTVCYESPRRILTTLSKLKEVDANRHVALCREMTKTFETIYRLTVAELLTHLERHPDEVRGELVLIIGPKLEDEVEELPQAAKKAVERLLPQIKVKEACSIIADLTGVSRNRLYDYALSLKKADE